MKGGFYKMGDYFSFRKMITPMLMKVFYCLGAITLLIGTFYFTIQAGVFGDGLASALKTFIIGLLLQMPFRISCETMMLFFSIHEKLIEIKKQW